MSKQKTMYTDQELLWAAQIAYCNINNGFIEDVIAEMLYL